MDQRGLEPPAAESSSMGIRPDDGDQRSAIVSTSALHALAHELGLDAIGAAAAAAYETTEAVIADRRARGLFADMKFTMAVPERSCHPERLFEGARTVISAALCYYAPGPEPGPGERQLPRYTWWDAYADLRDKLDRLGQRLGGTYRVLVDENDHVDREAAARAGVGFYGKNTMIITERHGSWIVLGTLVTDREIEATAPLSLDCGQCRLCIDACPTGALDTPGELDAGKCLSYWTQTANEPPPEIERELQGTVYGCDICQDVCPWNRGVEKRRADEPPPEDATPTVSLLEWLEADPDALRERFARFFVPRNDGRYLQRNALIAATADEITEDDTLRAAVERHAAGANPTLASLAGRLVAGIDR